MKDPVPSLAEGAGEGGAVWGDREPGHTINRPVARAQFRHILRIPQATMGEQQVDVDGTHRPLRMGTKYWKPNGRLEHFLKHSLGIASNQKFTFPWGPQDRRRSASLTSREK